MNYEHLNRIYQHWRKDLFPHMTHNFTVGTFDEYLKRLSYLPSFEWLRDFECIKLQRLGFAVDSKKFVKKYKDFCVTYNTPIKPEDGVQRMIYQFSPTLHAEGAVWAWIENEELHSYVSLFMCYNKVEEFLEMSDELWKIRKDGNTEEKKNLGFASPRATPFNPILGK